MDGLNFLFGLKAMKPINENMKSNNRIDDQFVCEDSVKTVTMIDSNDLTALLGYYEANAAECPKEICVQ